MEIGNFLINMGKELIMFNSFESMYLLLLFLIEIKQSISIKKYIFHVFMLSILNYVTCSIITIPGLLQVGIIIGLAVYTCLVFRITFLKALITNTKTYFMMFIFEMSLGMVYQYLFSKLLISMSNTDYVKFLYLLPVRLIEVLAIYLYYKMKRGEFSYGKTNKVNS